MEPSYRFDKEIGGDSLYELYRRYYVFNYPSNKDTFDSASINLLCNSLNDSLLLSYCYFDFQDMGKQWGKYEDGDLLSADFTHRIVTYSWNISEPNTIVAKWGDHPNETIQNILFECQLNKEYQCASSRGKGTEH